MATENNNEKLAPARTPYRFASPLLIAIIVTQALVSIVTYPFLPDKVPSHWNAAGQIDSYMPKLGMALLSPLMSIGIVVLVQGLIAISPKMGKQNPKADRSIMNLLLVGITLFMLIVQLASTIIALGIAIDMTMVINLALSVMYIFIGNYMGKIRRNFWAGIRTPWTLTNETVWERTHRFGGWLFVAGGLLGVLISFIPALRLYGVPGITAVIVIVSVVYSYVVYQQVVGAGKQPLSPPLD